MIARIMVIIDVSHWWSEFIADWLSQLLSEPNLPTPDWLRVWVQDETTVV